MRLQGKSDLPIPLFSAFWSVFFVFSGLVFSGLARPAWAAHSCFDFSPGAAVVREPLHAMASSDGAGDASGIADSHGISGVTWATVRAQVDTPIEAILKDLLAHRSTRSSRVDRLEIARLADPRYLERQEARFEVDPFPFISVVWTEAWAFALLQGTVEHPEKILVSYEKVRGTSHIEHLCGNYLLKKTGPSATDVFVYEEAKATGRSVKDTLDGLRGNLKAFEGDGRN